MSWPAFWGYRSKPLWQAKLLSPVGKLVCWWASRRFKQHLTHPATAASKAPVIVVGNLVVGGSGKTPFILWLYETLTEAGYRVGLISRGYGGASAHWPVFVTDQSDPYQVGDEPVLLVNRLKCAMAVGPDRAEAVRLLMDTAPVDIIISDDGLQHFSLARELEVVMVDGVRGFGNGKCLPAGPLREPLQRLKRVNFCVSNGPLTESVTMSLAQFLPGETIEFEVMQMEPVIFRNVADPSQVMPVTAFSNQKVYAMAGIGNPQRFFQTLENLDIRVYPKAFKDHKRYQEKDFLPFDGSKPLIMTEKDAVKCRQFAQSDWWYLETASVCSTALKNQVLSKVTMLLSNS